MLESQSDPFCKPSLIHLVWKFQQFNSDGQNSSGIQQDKHISFYGALQSGSILLVSARIFQKGLMKHFFQTKTSNLEHFPKRLCILDQSKFRRQMDRFLFGMVNKEYTRVGKQRYHTVQPSLN